MKKFVCLVWTAALLLLLCSCGKSAQVKAVEQQIGQIGEVTLEKGEEIAAVAEAFRSLTDQEQEKVSNAETLTDAQKEYRSLCVKSFETFVEQNPYPCGAENHEGGYRVDMDLVQKYQDQLDFLEENNIPDTACSSYQYAKAVAGLKKFQPDLEFMKAFSLTTETVFDALNDMSEGIQASNIGNNDICFSRFNTAAAKLESAEKLVELLDQDAEKMGEFKECLNLLSGGATNTATGLYTSSDFLFSIGKNTIVEQMTAYIDFYSDAQKLEADILEEEDTIQNLQV